MTHDDETVELVTWLRAYARALQTSGEPTHGNDEGFNLAADAITTLRAENEALRAALEPFACRTGGFLGNITDADVSRARAALKDRVKP